MKAIVFMYTNAIVPEILHIYHTVSVCVYALFQSQNSKCNANAHFTLASNEAKNDKRISFAEMCVIFNNISFVCLQKKKDADKKYMIKKVTKMKCAV